MNFLILDTNILISLLQRKNPQLAQDVQSFFNEYYRHTFAITGDILAEFLQGIQKSKQEKYFPFLKKLKFFSGNWEIYEKAGELSYALNHKGQKVPLRDCIIAATCLYYNTPLVTFDQHFKRFSDLQILTPQLT